MLLINEYEFMFNKNHLRKRNDENVYYWICVKKSGVTFRITTYKYITLLQKI